MASNEQIKLSSKIHLSMSTFDCPICMEILRPPIFLCNLGHSICGSCKEKMANCPTCRQPILPMRNFHLEDIVNQSVKVECKFCVQKFKMGDLEGHQKSCDNRPIDCVMNNCNEKGINLKEYSKHLFSGHQFTNCSSILIVNDFSLKKASNTKESMIKSLIKVDGFNFVAHFTYRNDLFYIWIRCIEEFDEKLLDNFVASISIFKNDPAKDGVKIHCKVYSIRKTFVDLEPKLFPIKLLTLYHQWGLEPESYCKLTIDIQKTTINIRI